MNIERLIKWLLPHFLIKPKQLGWIKSLLSPVIWLYDGYVQYSYEKLYEATINSQVNRITEALRTKFGSELIELIHTSDYLAQSFIYLEIEGSIEEFDYLESDGHLPVEYDHIQIEYDQQFDFVVRIPVALIDQVPVITAFVNKYKFSSKRFNIETL